jgi:hypothetical protein
VIIMVAVKLNLRERAFLPRLRYVGVGITAVFVAMLALFFAQDLFSLGLGLVLLVMPPSPSERAESQHGLPSRAC